MYSFFFFMEMTEDKKEIKQISIRNYDKFDIILHT